MKVKTNQSSYRWRRLSLGLLFMLVAALLLWRGLYLQVFNKDFLQTQGDARSLRVVTVAAHRGMIVDRNHEPLAISTPVDSIWANPQELIADRQAIAKLARALELDVDHLMRRLSRNTKREFVYLKRHLPPNEAARILDLNAPGVFSQREYRRYYPAGEVAAHVVGFTNIDDVGQEGIELAYDEWLRGRPGSKRVIKDRLGRIVENVESIETMQPGKPLMLSLDRRLQYLAYRELTKAVRQHKARSGSLVLLDVQTGEVLALVNQPAFNPNNRNALRASRTRNRALTDVFEPGSTIKPFTIAAALVSGDYRPTTPIDTTPGFMRVGRDQVTDTNNYGLINVARVITKSSNVGASKIALSLEPEQLWEVFTQVGFGRSTFSGFPGEAAGVLPHYHRWHPIEHATLSFGYGLSVTPLQLAQAYATLAAHGVQRPVSFLRVDEVPQGQRVLPAQVARDVITMLETVVSDEGTAKLAQVSGYRVAGKTGTVHKSTAGGYAEDRYLSLFAGLAPATRPRLAMVVMINEPRGDLYFGGQVAGPVFSQVMTGALRLLNIAPDGPLPEQAHMAQVTP